MTDTKQLDRLRAISDYLEGLDNPNDARFLRQVGDELEAREAVATIVRHEYTDGSPPENGFSNADWGRIEALEPGTRLYTTPPAPQVPFLPVDPELDAEVDRLVEQHTGRLRTKPMPAPQVPDGYVLAPISMTGEVEQIIRANLAMPYNTGSKYRPLHIWQALVKHFAAAPQPDGGVDDA